jgi:hypothetical protein
MAASLRHSGAFLATGVADRERQRTRRPRSNAGTSRSSPTSGRKLLRTYHADAITWATLKREQVRINALGGDERTRTADPLLAKQVLYQLSYVPHVPASRRPL